MKYKTENEFCIETTKILVGICIDDDSRYICVPEVPKGFFSNDHTDMLIMNMKRKEMFAIEYKLNDLKGLKHQLIMNQKVRTIGIINKEIPSEPVSIDNFNINLFGYTGKDCEIDKLFHKLSISETFWTSIYYSGWARFYYYAFKNNKSNLDGGLKNCKRKTFHHYYIQAIKNLQKDYDNKLDFMIVNAVFNVGYSISTAKKYYKIAMVHNNKACGAISNNVVLGAGHEI